MSFFQSNLAQRIWTGVIFGFAISLILLMAPNNVFFRILSGVTMLAFFGHALREWLIITSSSSQKFLWWSFGFIYILFPPAYYCFYILNNLSLENKIGVLILMSVVFIFTLVKDIAKEFISDKITVIILVVLVSPAILYLHDLVRDKSISPEETAIWVVLVMTLAFVWATDIGGYVVGKTIGGWKLAPSISPNKTWAGFIGGFAFVYFVFFLAADKIIISSSQYFIPFFICLVAQLGDLFESWVKRKFGVKDSGNILPGHGGMLDRIDGLIPALWLMFILLEVVKL